MDQIPPVQAFWAAVFLAVLGLMVLFAVKSFIARLLELAVMLSRMTGEAIGVAAAWPIEKLLDGLDRWVARGVEWRERRRIWRAEFRGTVSWEAFQRQLQANAPVRDDLAEAFGLLGLREPFTKADLDTRFKRTIAAVHPDKGGSDMLARMTTEARALILKHKGWKR